MRERNEEERGIICTTRKDRVTWLTAFCFQVFTPLVSHPISIVFRLLVFHFILRRWICFPGSLPRQLRRVSRDYVRPPGSGRFVFSIFVPLSISHSHSFTTQSPSLVSRYSRKIVITSGAELWEVQLDRLGLVGPMSLPLKLSNFFKFKIAFWVLSY